jgi:hypothetical protein
MGLTINVTEKMFEMFHVTINEGALDGKCFLRKHYLDLQTFLSLKPFRRIWQNADAEKFYKADRQ